MKFKNYPSDNPKEELNAYISLYLREEIMLEGITRDLPRFSRLLKTAALSNAQTINFTKLASDVGCAPSTAIEHFRILEDTLVGFFVEPWGQSRKRKEIASAKFYLFDTGVCAALAGTQSIDRNSDLFGRAFEHFIAMEIRAALSYKRVSDQLTFWRTRDKREVDFVISNKLAVEVKASQKISKREASGLIAIQEEQKINHRCLVSFDPLARKEEGVRFLPWKQFLDELWQGVYF